MLPQSSEVHSYDSERVCTTTACRMRSDVCDDNTQDYDSDDDNNMDDSTNNSMDIHNNMNNSTDDANNDMNMDTNSRSHNNNSYVRTDNSL